MGEFPAIAMTGTHSALGYCRARTGFPSGPRRPGPTRTRATSRRRGRTTAPPRSRRSETPTRRRSQAACGWATWCVHGAPAQTCLGRTQLEQRAGMGRPEHVPAPTSLAAPEPARPLIGTDLAERRHERAFPRGALGKISVADESTLATATPTGLFPAGPASIRPPSQVRPVASLSAGRLRRLPRRALPDGAEPTATRRALSTGTTFRSPGVTR